MDTDELIDALVADTRRAAAPLSIVWWRAAGCAIVLAAAVFFATVGPRPDIAAVAAAPLFVFKLVVTITLAASSFGVVRVLSRPGDTLSKAARYLTAVPALLVTGVVIELFLSPADTWLVKIVGTNNIASLSYIALIGVGPLAIFLLALRQAAPTRPRFAGAVAGLLSGGIASTLYAFRCTDDSLLFVATWYPLAIGGLALVGAVSADRFARW